jgi:hypothetical protein
MRMIGEAACEPGDRERIDTVEHCTRTFSCNVLRIDGVFDALRGGDCEKRRDRGRENEGSAVDALVIDDDTGTRAESARGVQAIGDRSNHHIDLPCEIRV